MKIQSAIILGIATVIAPTTHADVWESARESDDKRPSYCATEAFERIPIKASTTSSICYSVADGGYGRDRFEAEQTCVEFKLATKDGDCAVSTVAYSTAHPGCLLHKIDYFRRPSLNEQLDHVCRSVADCLGKAFAKDDVRGIDWSNSMSAKLGCK